MIDDAGAAVRPEPVDTQLFTYSRQLAPMMWALVALGAVEIAVVHLLLWHWLPAVALALGVVSGAAILWLVALILSFRARPVAIGPESVRLRTGFLIDTQVPLGEIAFVQSGNAAADYMPGSLLKASLIAWPNAVLLLRRDIELPGAFGRRKRVHAVALALDEPARFLAALEARVKQAPAGEGSLAA